MIAGEYSQLHKEYIEKVLSHIPTEVITYLGERICEYYVENRTPTTVMLHLVFYREFFNQFETQPRYVIRRVRGFLDIIPARRIEILAETPKAGRFLEFLGFSKVCVLDKYFYDIDFTLYRRINE